MFRYKLSKIIFVPFIVLFIYLILSGESVESNIYDDKGIRTYPSEIQMLKRTFPYYKFDASAYPEMVREYNKSKENFRLQKRNINNQLEFVGPTNIGGRIVDIEINPNDQNIVYAAAATGGVFKSVDSGESWFPIFDDQPCLSIGDIAIDPNNTNTIYVGTGEANGGHNNFPGQGVFKSTDAGETWSYIGLGKTVSIGRIVVDPKNSNKLFIAAVGSYFTPNSARGVFISNDAGITWQSSLFVSDSTGAIDIAINPENTNEVYAAMWERVRRPVFSSTTHLSGPTGGIYKSTDGGNSWQKILPESGLPNPDSQEIGRIGLAISKSNPNILYALFNDGFRITGLYRTDDKGLSWTLVNNNIPGGGDFSWYFGQVRVNPLNPDIVYVLDVYLSKSVDGGKTFQLLYDNNNLHVDHHALAFSPIDTSIVFSGNDGGINISVDAGKSWSIPASLPITQFYEIGLDRNNPNTYLGGTQDNNTIISKSGNVNSWERIYGGDGFYVIVDPENSNIIYAESQFGYLGKSIDGGNTFKTVLNGIENEPKNWSTPVLMDPNNNQVLYYGTHSLYRTEDAASNWTKISPQLTNWTPERKLGTITTIDVAPTNSNIIYVGTDDGNLWVSSNYGLNWENISSGLPVRWITRVKVDPNDENIVYVTFSGLKWAESEPHVFRSADRGKTWDSIINGLPNAPVNAFEINPQNTRNLFLGNDVGVYTSYDSGNNWELLTDQIPIVVINDLKIHPTENYLAIGTHGRGVYRIDLSQLSSNGDKKNIENNFELKQNYPNPFNPTTTIEYSIPIATSNSGIRKVNLDVYDLLGRKVKTLVNSNQTPGNYKIPFDASSLSSGIYYYHLKVGEYIKTKKMLLLK